MGGPQNNKKHFNFDILFFLFLCTRNPKTEATKKTFQFSFLLFSFCTRNPNTGATKKTFQFLALLFSFFYVQETPRQGLAMMDKMEHLANKLDNDGQNGRFGSQAVPGFLDQKKKTPFC